MLTDVYNCNRGNVVLDSAFARANYDFLFQSQDMRYGLTWERMLLGKISKPHLHGNILNGECMPFNLPCLRFMIGSDKRERGEERYVADN